MPKEIDAIKQEDDSFLNAAGAVVNEEGHLVDDDGALINEAGFLINETGQLLNATGEAVDAEGNLVGEDGKRLDDDDGHMIPKRRYDSAASRADKAEAALKTANEKLEAQSNSSGGGPTTEAEFTAKIDELDVKIEDARKDNDMDAVIRLNKEQRDAERGMYSAMAKSEASSAGTATQQKIALDNMIEQLEADHPFFNPNNKAFDQSLVDEVVDLQHSFVAGGDTPAAAMAKAVGYAMPKAKEAEGEGDGKTDVKKNLKAAAGQAPKMGETGKGSGEGGDTGDVGDVDKLSEKEYDALPLETRKRLRGDINTTA